MQFLSRPCRPDAEPIVGVIPEEVGVVLGEEAARPSEQDGACGQVGEGEGGAGAE